MERVCGWLEEKARLLLVTKLVLAVKLHGDHRTGRGRTSGLEVGQIGSRAATLFQILDGRVVKLVLYWDRDRALADLGLAPGAGAAEAPG